MKWTSNNHSIKFTEIDLANYWGYVLVGSLIIVVIKLFLVCACGNPETLRRYDYKPLTGGNENTARGGWIVINYALFTIILLSAGVWLLFRGYNYLKLI
jgi:hypothetical protein